jgi:hypothetical protein
MFSAFHHADRYPLHTNLRRRATPPHSPSFHSPRHWIWHGLGKNRPRSVAVDRNCPWVHEGTPIGLPMGSRGDTNRIAHVPMLWVWHHNTQPVLRASLTVHIAFRHSDRRNALAESHRLIASKVSAAIEAGMHANITIGESREQNDRGETVDVIIGQLRDATADLKPFGALCWDRIVVACVALFPHALHSFCMRCTLSACGHASGVCFRRQ